MMGGDVAPKVSAFRQFMANVSEQVCQEFEREVSQLSEDIVKYRGELARCADLLAFQLGKEKQYHNMLENICQNTSVLVGRSGEVGQKHSGNEDAKRQMQQMLEDMFNGSAGHHAGFHEEIDGHRQMSEQHLMTSRELQDQSSAVQKELDNILETLKMPPVSYTAAPMIVGPSMMGGQQQQQYGAPMSAAQLRTNSPRSPGAGMLNTPLIQQRQPGYQSPTRGVMSPNGTQNYGQYRQGGMQQSWS